MEMITGDALDQALEDVRLSEDSFQAAYDIFVPDRGPAPSVGGEVLRAMMKIMYRDENDGDLFYEGYGKETCGDAVSYLIKFDPSLEKDFGAIAEDELKDEEYTDALAEISLYLGERLFLRQPELFEKVNTDDYQKYDGPKFIEYMGWEPSYDWEEYLPDSLIELLDAGVVDKYEIESDIEYWDCVSACDADVTVSREGLVQINNCDRDCLTDLEENGANWLEQIAEDLRAEYADELEEEEEDEEY